MTAATYTSDFHTPPSRTLWAGAAVAALVLHLSLAAFLITTLEADEDADLGAPGIAIGLELAAPNAEATDLPPGPDSEASAAAPDVPEQKAVIKESALPKDTPTETDDPDRVVTENKSEKPQEDDPNSEATPAMPSTQSVASEATAMPTLQSVPEAQVATTRDQGTGESKQRLKTTWANELVAHLDKHKKYPADRAQQSAQILVNFVLDRLGHVQSVSIVKSSGDAAFDNAAIAMIRRSDPVPPPPPLVADETLSFTLPVNFRVKSKR